MYNDLQKDDLPTPESPTQVEEEFRARYPVKLSLVEVERPNPLSEEMEKRQILAIEDSGIGMDEEIIKRYFLQVGQSYYTTEEFRRSFRFVPTSRFGIGFLSVFAVSNHVTVETYKPSSPNQSGPSRLTLTGPRTYLLTEVGQRRSCGTRIDVLLQEPMTQGQLTSLVSSWCKRVEFPISVNDLGLETAIVSEKPDEFTYEVPDATEEGAKLAVRAFPVDRPGIEGDLYVFELVNNKGESWAAWNWANYTYPSQTPQASAPKFPSELICFHGISTGESGYSHGPMGMRIDYRGDAYHPTVSRENAGARRTVRNGNDPRIASRWEELLKEHLATSPRAAGYEGWKYKQRLVKDFPLSTFWSALPETIRVYRNGLSQLVSLEEIRALSMITTFGKPKTINSIVGRTTQNTSNQSYIPSNPNYVMIGGDIDLLSDEHRAEIFRDRSINNVQWVENKYLSIEWELNSEKKGAFQAGFGDVMEVVALPDSLDVIGIVIHKTINSTYEHILLNADNPFVQWLLYVKECCEQNKYGLQKEQLIRLIGLVATPIRYSSYKLNELVAYLRGWQNLPNIPSELCPPEIELTDEMFRLTLPSLDGGESKEMLKQSVPRKRVQSKVKKPRK